MVKNLLIFEEKKVLTLFPILILLIIFFRCGKDENEGKIKPIKNYGEVEPTFSIDGKFIAYTKIPEYEIWLFEIATEESEYLTDGSLPDWSPDGKEIVYVNNSDIYKINLETKEIKQLTTWGSCFFPDWSSNNELLAFDFSYHTSGFDSFGVWILDLSNNSKRHLGEGREPNWSPSGDKLAHIRYLAGVTSREIFIMDSSGQNSVRLTNNHLDDYHPAWSPDGSKIAYVHVAYNSDSQFCYNIWIMDTNGNNKTPLTFETEGMYGNRAYEPTWFPDGNQIVYVYTYIIEKQYEIECISHLWIMDADGENKRQLTGKVIETFGCK
jgi:Tol biopolymer transport system component